MAGQAVGVEDIGERTAFLLDLCLRRSELQSVRAALLWEQVHRALGVSLVEESQRALRVPFGCLAVDAHFGVVIDRERLLRGRVIDRDAEEGRVGTEGGHGFESERAAVEQFVVPDRRRILRGQTFHRIAHACRTDDDEVGVVQAALAAVLRPSVNELLDFFLGIGGIGFR